MVARRLNSCYDCRKSKLGGVVERHLEQVRTEGGLQVGSGEMSAAGQSQILDEIHPDHLPSQGRDGSLHMGVLVGYMRGNCRLPARGEPREL